MTERLKTVAIFMLLALSIGLFVDYQFNSKSIEVLFDDFKRSEHSYDVSRFRYAYGVLEKLQQDQLTDATYLLFVTADINASSLAGTEISTSLEEDLADFKIQYYEFMKSQCALAHSKACLSFGYLLEKTGEYDLAYKAFKKSADGGELAAMSALVDLYRNTEWPRHSEIVAKEWLYKVGKQ